MIVRKEFENKDKQNGGNIVGGSSKVRRTKHNRKCVLCQAENQNSAKHNADHEER